MEITIFYFFSTILIASAGAVVSVKNPVHAALFLILAFFSSAAIWLLLEAEFLAIVLVLVYVGAVMVLFLFVVMMLDVNIISMREGFMRHLPVGALVAVAMFAEMVTVVGAERFGLEHFGTGFKHGADYSNTKELGNVLYTVYVYPFEISAVLLLVAIIAAIVLAMRKRPKNKQLDPAKQVLVKRSERLRLISMPSEKTVIEELK